MSFQDDKKYLEAMVALISDPKLRRACDGVLQDPRFLASPAAAKKHQAYEGGLVVHTAEVLRIALATAGSIKDLSSDVIIAGTLWHDYGKIWDYEEVNPVYDVDEDNPRYGYTRHRWTTRHLTRSYAEFVSAARQAIVDPDLVEEVGHCILAHHGRQEWGSPVLPLTPEAFIVHMADTLSARFTEKLHIFRVKRGKNGWKDDPTKRFQPS